MFTTIAITTSSVSALNQITQPIANVPVIGHEQRDTDVNRSGRCSKQLSTFIESMNYYTLERVNILNFRIKFSEMTSLNHESSLFRKKYHFNVHFSF